MKIIAKTGEYTFLLEASADEIDRLAGKQIGKAGAYSWQRDIPFGTEFNIIKAFAAVNKTPIAAGEISRIGMICQDSYSNDIVVTDLEAYIAQLGGLIATYKHGVMLRQDRKSANDNTIISTRNITRPSAKNGPLCSRMAGTS